MLVREIVNFSSYWRSSTFSSTVEPTIYLLAFGFGFGSAHLRRDSRCARRHEELVTAEALWIATRAGVYGCVPMLVALAFGLDPAWGMLTVPGIAFLAGFGWACFGISVAGYATSIEIQLHRQRRSHATVPRRRHVLPVERAAAMGTDRG